MSPRNLLHKLSTEQRNRASRHLDLRSAAEIARIINREDRKVAGAVAHALPQIAQAMEAIARAIGAGGRLIYVGAGTSGRLAALDAAECAPTFNIDPKTVQYVMAGGDKALGRSTESSEDSRQEGQRDLARRRPTRRDVVVGLAASGCTPYTVAALQFARKRGAYTVAVTCNYNTPLARVADIAIVAAVGPEVVTGSTRLKAGTAQKLILNMLTTGAMTRLGYVFDNLMVNVTPKNSKLTERGMGILQTLAKISRANAVRALKASGKSVPVALVMLLGHVQRQAAEKLLRSVRGNVRQAVEAALDSK
ncbi:MAG TPA: N-acetylmuramic acid 6-phosphate etherase [Terriglobales bacterium]|jgi:N-acetylmuramic acid 6-phosphate etherase|nr:N-acetylmuramic acid 6-phosphate etherase [Terriglobales bacterium]